MSVHEVWFLLALALIIGGFGGSLIGNWQAGRQCCECCTCEDCRMRDHHEEWASGRFTHRGEDDELLSDFKNRRTVVLEPGPTIYPELAALAEQTLDGPQIDAERPDTGTWMRTLRIKWESEYPIPGTPQWEARHPVGVS